MAKLSSLQTLLVFAAEHDLEVHQMDVKSAYLNAPLKEEIYMEAPPSFDIPESMVLCLLKVVYGTKQGGHIWYKHIHVTLESMGYTHLELDHVVFICIIDGAISIISLYVNDVTMLCKSLKTINQDKEALKRSYQMTDLGEISWILGIQVTCNRDKGTIAMSQEKFIKEILNCFKKSQIWPISTPTLLNEHLTKLSAPEINAKSYQSIVGALMYPMLSTHPDLAYTVGALG